MHGRGAPEHSGTKESTVSSIPENPAEMKGTIASVGTRAVKDPASSAGPRTSLEAFVEGRTDVAGRRRLGMS